MTALEQTSKDWIYFIAAGSPGVLMVNKNSEYDTMEEIMTQLESDPQSISIAGTTGGYGLHKQNFLIVMEICHLTGFHMMVLEQH
ncbi:hypothetical protein AN641_05475 [Candidatus Epulonipiscioides gigas]|nr:hypothetical protein AN641_05475 [Epulopiscium sp. SCG-C07WGA-EpuloA2]